MSKKTKNDIVAEAERILQELEKRRADHAARRSELEDARKTHAYAAHAQHDAAASRLLDGIITEVAKHDQQTKALTDAIDEASRRVAFAREREQREQEKAKATALLARFEGLAEHGAAVDAGLYIARAG